MYDYIKGIIKEIKSNGIVLENNGIGYFVNTPNPYAFGLDDEALVYIYQLVREDEISLFGFKTSEEKDLFLKLLDVKGLGPRMALPILATGSISGIVDAINRENIIYLKKFPKIGDKVAKQMILDLKGKLGEFTTDGDNYNINNEELHDVLISLGYKDKEIKAIIPQVNNNLTIEEQVKEALKLLLK